MSSISRTPHENIIYTASILSIRWYSEEEGDKDGECFSVDQEGSLSDPRRRSNQDSVGYEDRDAYGGPGLVLGGSIEADCGGGAWEPTGPASIILDVSDGCADKSSPRHPVQRHRLDSIKNLCSSGEGRGCVLAHPGLDVLGGIEGVLPDLSHESKQPPIQRHLSERRALGILASEDQAPNQSPSRRLHHPQIRDTGRDTVSVCEHAHRRTALPDPLPYEQIHVCFLGFAGVAPVQHAPSRLRVGRQSEQGELYTRLRLAEPRGPAGSIRQSTRSIRADERLRGHNQENLSSFSNVVTEIPGRPVSVRTSSITASFRPARNKITRPMKHLVAALFQDAEGVPSPASQEQATRKNAPSADQPNGGPTAATGRPSNRRFS
jgi:hypothetical protein